MYWHWRNGAKHVLRARRCKLVPLTGPGSFSALLEPCRDDPIGAFGSMAHARAARQPEASVLGVAVRTFGMDGRR